MCTWVGSLVPPAPAAHCPGFSPRPPRRWALEGGAGTCRRATCPSSRNRWEGSPSCLACVRPMLRRWEQERVQAREGEGAFSTSFWKNTTHVLCFCGLDRAGVSRDRSWEAQALKASVEKPGRRPICSLRSPGPSAGAAAPPCALAVQAPSRECQHAVHLWALQTLYWHLVVLKVM